MTVPRAVVALGSNLGDRLAHLRGAVTDLAAIGEVVSVASLYETDPVGGPTQGRFLNSAVLLDTDLTPRRLLEALHRIEDDHGRTREVEWGPRTLDLDLITYASERIEDTDLVIPHPRAVERRFVLEPVVEVAPDVELSPGRTATDAVRDARTSTGMILRFHGDWASDPPGLGGIGPLLLGLQALLIVATVVLALTTATPPVPTWQTYAGLALAASAAVMSAWGGVALGRSLRALPDPAPGGEMVMRGPYGFVRHPIYGAILLGGLGLALMFNSTWAVLPLALLAVLFVRKSSLEERAISLVHPEYSAYRIRVPRRFVPWVW